MGKYAKPWEKYTEIFTILQASWQRRAHTLAIVVLTPALLDMKRKLLLSVKKKKRPRGDFKKLKCYKSSKKKPTNKETHAAVK